MFTFGGFGFKEATPGMHLVTRAQGGGIIFVLEKERDVIATIAHGTGLEFSEGIWHLLRPDSERYFRASVDRAKFWVLPIGLMSLRMLLLPHRQGTVLCNRLKPNLSVRTCELDL